MVKTDVGVGVFAPTVGGHGLDTQDRHAVWQDALLVVCRLSIESVEVWQGDDTGRQAGGGKFLGGVNSKRNLRTGGSQDQSCVLNIKDHVTTSRSLFDGGAFQLWQTLSGQGDHRWGDGGFEGDLVCCRDFVTVGWSPDHQVWNGSEMGQGLDRLMGWTVFTQTDGVVGGDPDDWVAGKGRQSEGAGGVGNEVQEGTTVGLVVGAESGDTVHDGTHGVLTDTVTDVTAGVVTQAQRRRLEVDGVGPSGQVGRSQVCRTTNEFWQVLFQLT